MSENGVNDSSHPEQSKEIMMPGVRNMNQFSLNGRASSQDSSRGSSPSPYMASIPASQLPPSRSIPASQLPPSSSINTVTQKVSQLSVQNQLLSNVNRPNSTSTPNETADLPKNLL
ncbi:hypothetical protein HHI36_011415 [Cryptolaemus montrouzieri]|uniref:Uncharacterized protein n=1 Tax=Cryptolaemus montrouzieri TaxID=559131 RepID=A0ABD2MLT8_9CUCU